MRIRNTVSDRTSNSSSFAGVSGRVRQQGVRAYHVNYLQDVVVGVEVQGSDVDLHELPAEEIVGQLLHLLGPGGGPHQNLAMEK